MAYGCRYKNGLWLKTFLLFLILLAVILFLRRSETTKTTIQSKRRILLFVAVYSAPGYIDRRNAVRETWMRKCKSNEKVVCWFISDGQDAKGRPMELPVKSKLENESSFFGDLLLAQSPSGTNFARRYVWMAQWASEHYDFQYLLRVDDDYFICFERLLLELEFHRPKQNLIWGWLHCQIKGAVAIDEGFVIVTKNLIDSILGRLNTTLLCHPYGGQAMGMWLKDFPNLQTFGDNKRIFHMSFDAKEKAAKRNEICKTALSIHKSYPEEMKIYWKVYQKEKSNSTYVVPPISFPCRLPLGINYKIFGRKWFAEPRLCKDDPVWDLRFEGRQRQ